MYAENTVSFRGASPRILIIVLATPNGFIIQSRGPKKEFEMTKRGLDADEVMELTKKILAVAKDGRPTIQTVRAALECATALIPSLDLANTYTEI
jgi:hypothetical protein